jgi:hypothetical protein
MTLSEKDLKKAQTMFLQKAYYPTLFFCTGYLPYLVEKIIWGAFVYVVGMVPDGTVPVPLCCYYFWGSPVGTGTRYPVPVLMYVVYR